PLGHPQARRLAEPIEHLGSIPGLPGQADGPRLADQGPVQVGAGAVALLLALHRQPAVVVAPFLRPLPPLRPRPPCRPPPPPPPGPPPPGGGPAAARGRRPPPAAPCTVWRSSAPDTRRSAGRPRPARRPDTARRPAPARWPSRSAWSGPSPGTSSPPSPARRAPASTASPGRFCAP